VNESLGVLGSLEVVGQRGPAPLRPAQRRLLAILLLDAENEVARELLLDRMWGEAPPATAAASLHVHVSGLRRAVPGLITTTPAGYRVELDGRRYDRIEFDELVRRANGSARAGSWPAALDAASRALRRWRGLPFADLSSDEFAAPEINRLTERRIDMLELRARALLAGGRTDEAIGQLHELVLQHPLREPLWEQLMQALYRSGRRAEALRAFQRMRQVLAEELDVEPGVALRELGERMLADEPALGVPESAPGIGHLPVTATSFVGREADVQQLSGLLRGRRSVTIVGGPGYGKTRLAVETGHLLAADHPAGVWFASLADARKPIDVAGAIATATDLRDHVRSLDHVVKRLAHRPALLILDNCEHLLETCAGFVAQVIASGGAMKVLATSRRPLGFEGEQTWRIEPLAPPGREVGVAGPASPASRSPAVQLFVDRARAADRSFQLTAETAPALAELCRRAEGIPLALELAARWVPALGLDDIGEVLAGEPPGTGRGGLDHHRSLTAAIEWSLALLSPEDRRLFVRTAIFNGRFALDDIRAVCAPEQERRRLAHAVAGLANASLIGVERQPDGAALYRLPGPIREFADRELAATAALSATRDRFVSHYLARVYKDLDEPLQHVVDLERVDRDIDNLRAAFEMGLEMGRADDVARLLVQLDGYMLNRYLLTERRPWLERAAQACTDPLTRAHALRSLGSGAQATFEPDESLQYFRQALLLFRELDDRLGLAHCLLSLSGAHAMRGAWAEGISAAEEARAIVSDLGSATGLAVAVYYIGENQAYGGDIESGLARLEEAAQLYENAGQPGRAAYALSTLISVAVAAGEEGIARRSVARALTLADGSNSMFQRLRARSSSALIEARYGDTETARQMLREVHELIEPGEPDGVVQLLLPAVFLLRRMGRLGLALEVVAASEAALAVAGVALPTPWRDAVDSWTREARPARGSRPARPGRTPSRGVEQVTADLLEELARPGRVAARSAGPRRSVAHASSRRGRRTARP